MHCVHATSFFLVGLMLGSATLQAHERIKIEVVQTHTSVKTSVGSFVVSGTPATSVTHCSGTSGIYSKVYGYDCNTTDYPSTPEHTQSYLDHIFLYDANVIMPGGARWTLHCSNISNKHCEGFPSYPETTSVTCNSFVFSGDYYQDCTAKGLASNSIGLYDAEVKGDTVIIIGTKWKRKYERQSEWESETTSPAGQGTGNPQPSAESNLGNIVANKTPPALQVAANVNSGNEIAQVNLGVQYDQGSGVPLDHVQAAALYRKAAEQGYAVAQYFLGYDYSAGQGVPQDYKEAAVWYRKAAEQGYFYAQYNLATLYYAGLGVPQDYAQAAIWARKAADQNDPTAECSLGLFYEFGNGVPQDYSEAYFWLDVGSALTNGADHDTCLKNRDDSASKLSPADLSKVQERAAKWFAERQAQP